MAEREIPQTRATKSVAAQAQVTVDPTAPFTQVAGLFDNLADVANESANQSTIKLAQEKAAQDLRNNPEGVPALRAGTSIAASTYNNTAKQLYSVQNDSETMAHMLGLKNQFEANPAGYKEASDAYLQSKIKSTESFDPAQAVRLQAKFSLLQETTIPDLQEQAEEKLAEQQKQDLDLFNQATQHTVESVVNRMFDPNHSEKVTRQLAMMGQNLHATMTGAIDPQTQEPLFSPAQIDARLRTFWEDATEDGLLAQIPRLSDEELLDWQNKMSDDTFTTKFFSEEGSADIELNKIMSADKRRGLLSRIETQIRQRNSLQEGASYQAKIAFLRRMEDNVAYVENNGFSGADDINLEESKFFGVSPSAMKSYLGKLETANAKYRAKNLIIFSEAGMADAELRELEKTQQLGGVEGSAFLKTNTEEGRKALAVENEALHGSGNGAQYFNDNLPQLDNLYLEVQAGKVDSNVYFEELDNWYDKKGVSPSNRDYLPEAGINALAESFPSSIDFDKATGGELGTSGDAMAGFTQKLRTDLGSKFYGIVNQLFRDNKIPRDHAAMIFANPNDTQGMRDFGNAITEFEHFQDNTMFDDSTMDDIRTKVETELEDLRASFPFGQSGVERAMDTYADSMEKLTMYYMTRPGMNQDDAIENAKEVFLGQFEFIDAGNESTIQFPKLKEDGSVRTDSELGALSLGIKRLDSINQNLFADIKFYSTLDVKEGQQIGDVDEVFNERVVTQGQWKGLPDGKSLRLYEEGGAPIFYVGADGGVRTLDIPLDQVSQLGEKAITPTRITVSTSAPLVTSDTDKAIARERGVTNTWLNDFLELDLNRKPLFFVEGEE